MLGTAGTIAAEVFVLTGHAAAMAGPSAVLAMGLAGLLSYSIALNYSELATTYPVTGGALTYVREAWGSGLLAFIVGTLDCLSSTFYSALSAVGFAYSLRVFFPALPIVPTAIAVVAVFAVLNILGVSQVGNVQIVLGGVLLAFLGVYVVAGLLLPGGFRWEVFAPGGSLFIEHGWAANWANMLATIALIYNAYVGFEVIADDAEEVTNPQRNIPAGILISLTVITLVYVLVSLVTLGTVPWQQLAGSETALTDAVPHFLPRFGVPMMAVAGLIATLTSVNTAMLSATREAFTMSRDGAWPRFMSRLSRFRTPYVTILIIALLISLVAAVGLVDFLSYISSSGYLFVLFWASLAMLRLRKLDPDRPRPFRVPFFPLTAYLAAGACLLIIAFSSRQALLFGAGLLVVITLFYYTYRPFTRAIADRARALEQAKDRILVAAANPRTAVSLVRLSTLVAKAVEDGSVCVLTVVPVSPALPPERATRLVASLSGGPIKALLDDIREEARRKHVPLYTRLNPATSVAEGILAEVKENVRLLLMGWPGPLDQASGGENPVKVVLQKARTNVAVLFDRGLGEVRQVLVPVGGGPHSRLAVRLAYEIAEHEGARMTVLNCICEVCEGEELEDRMLQLREIVEDELGSVPPEVTLRLSSADTVSGGILKECAQHRYDLIVVGAAVEWVARTRLFGEVDDCVAEEARCSVLLVRRYEPAVISWLRHRARNGGRSNGR
jgi:amino acid transporter/nucleotide-binding universal stress UspA family protein